MVAGIVLAAGLSRRMGQPKQLLDWGGLPLVRHVALQALHAQLDHVIVVVNPAIPALAAALHDLPLTLVQNVAAATGQGGSVSLGVAALPAATSAALILLGDQPLITSALIDQLLGAAHVSPCSIIAPLINGKRANPVLFKADWFASLRHLSGDHGARALIAAHPDDLLLVPLDAPHADADIDHAADYARLYPLSQQK